MADARSLSVPSADPRSYLTKKPASNYLCIKARDTAAAIGFLTLVRRVGDSEDADSVLSGTRRAGLERVISPRWIGRLGVAFATRVD